MTRNVLFLPPRAGGVCMVESCGLHTGIGRYQKGDSKGIYWMYQFSYIWDIWRILIWHGCREPWWRLSHSKFLESIFLLRRPCSWRRSCGLREVRREFDGVICVSFFMAFVSWEVRETVDEDHLEEKGARENCSGPSLSDCYIDHTSGASCLAAPMSRLAEPGGLRFTARVANATSYPFW